MTDAKAATSPGAELTSQSTGLWADGSGLGYAASLPCGGTMFSGEHLQAVPQSCGWKWDIVDFGTVPTNCSFDNNNLNNTFSGDECIRFVLHASEGLFDPYCMANDSGDVVIFGCKESDPQTWAYNPNDDRIVNISATNNANAGAYMVNDPNIGIETECYSCQSSYHSEWAEA